MMKQGLYILVASILLVVFLPQVHIFLDYIGQAHTFLTKQLSHVFAGGKIGQLIRHSVVLFVVPVVVGFVPGGIYYVVKRAVMPYQLHVIWVLWVMLATALALK